MNLTHPLVDETLAEQFGIVQPVVGNHHRNGNKQTAHCVAKHDEDQPDPLDQTVVNVLKRIVLILCDGAFLQHLVVINKRVQLDGADHSAQKKNGEEQKNSPALIVHEHDTTDNGANAQEDVYNVKGDELHAADAHRK